MNILNIIHIKRWILLGLLIISLRWILGKIINNNQKKHLEGFDQVKNPWSKDLIARFNLYQQSINRNQVQFDLDILQNQATPEEAEELLKTGYWPWPKFLQDVYIHQVWNSPIVKVDPNHSLNYARTIYNKNAALHLLGWNEKEGEFLLYGVDNGITEGMPKDVRNSIKCNSTGAKSQLEKITYTGMNLWNGYMNYDTEMILPKDIPKEVKGFSFIKGVCDPCAALDGDNSCPFKLNVKGDETVSRPWKALWGLE